eukprot:9999861-Ditylum_brightwellii.AAC.1
METNEDDNELAIGAYELAFYADISATYTYKMRKEIFAKLMYAGLYQDDGLAIFEAELWSPLSDTSTNPDMMEADEMDETQIPENERDKWEEKVMV